MKQRLDKLGRPQPSDEALKWMIKFFLKTSVPRILAEKQEATQKEA